MSRDDETGEAHCSCGGYVYIEKMCMCEEIVRLRIELDGALTAAEIEAVERRRLQDSIAELEERLHESEENVCALLEEALPPSEGHDFDTLYPLDDDDQLLNPAGARREIVELREKLIERDAKIEEIEKENTWKASMYMICGDYYPIFESDVDKAWDEASKWKDAGPSLAALGFVECPECHGSKMVERILPDGGMIIACPTCLRNRIPHGWVWSK